ncbi:MAG: two-component system sensor histidine kinase ArlS, partial [Glaciecola sp.]
TAIMGEAEIVISKSRTNEEYFQSMKTILTEADILNATVNNLLQLSKVSANEENIQYEIIHFDLFLMEVKESFNFFNPQNKIKLNINKQEKKEGAFTISGNKNLLKTAIINLFDNACKFSSNQQVSVLLSRDNEHLILTIKDKGIGIFDKDLENILTPFYRGNNAIKIKGSGIGLSLSSKIILLHQGVLKIQSKIGIGTEVIVELPFN